MYVTLNISNRSIKILSVKGRQVKKWGNLALTNGLVRDGLILQPQAVGEAIASLFKSTGVPKERVITSLAGLSFTYRFLNMPRMKPALLDEAILRAAKKEISMSLDELYLSWQLLPGQGDEQTYFVLGVPRNFVDALVETLKIAGIEPYLMDLQPLALARAANRRDAIIVNMEPDCFDIVFIANGIPAVIHTINPRSEGATLEDNIRRLADELTKTAAFYQSRHPESTLSQATPLLLTGDLALVTPASGLLQSEIEYPIEPMVPPVDSPPELPVTSYIANIGLALKKSPLKAAAGSEDSRFHDININIFYGKYRKIRAKSLPAGYMILWTFLAIAIVLLLPLYQSLNKLTAENARQQSEFSDISRELDFAKLISEENAQTDNTIRQIITGTEALKAANQSLLVTRGGFTRNLRLVTEALPPATYFTSIEINNKLVTVRGETDSVFAVVDYATALELKEIFPEVRITELDETMSIVPGANATSTEPIIFRLIKFGIIMNK
jgi:Tfp pilus assembly protein PilN/alkylated DNA nucleotide flippase Atl1